MFLRNGQPISSHGPAAPTAARPVSFEPPRAGATRPLWGLWFAFLRRSGLQQPSVRLKLPTVRWTLKGVAAVVVPIYGWFATGRRSLAWPLALLYLVCALIAVACLGQAAAGWAAGIMISLHGLGAAEYLFSDGWSRRALACAGVMLGLAIVYPMMGKRLLAPIVVPLETHQGPLLINPSTRRDRFAVDELVAYRGAEWREGHYRVPSGIHVGRVLARPGEVVKFSRQTFSVNGRVRHRRPLMPVSGEVTVPLDRLFIWPLGIKDTFDAGLAAKFAANPAMVADGAFLGRPYARWFWRTQDL